MLRALLEKRLQAIWYEGAAGAALLAPLEALYKAYIKHRRKQYLSGKKYRYRSPAPVIVVGNLVAGGAGKTPLALAICKHLSASGMRPGILSRGYKAHTQIFPRLVKPEDSAHEVGDEPLLMAQRSVAPICIDPQRTRGAAWLVAEHACDIVVSDDGLQHYALQRDIEIVVIDALRGLGNQRCLPAGPLREPAERLRGVDFVVYNGRNCDAPQPPTDYGMQLEPAALVRLNDNQPIGRNQLQTLLSTKSLHAVTGIGNPQRFFRSLRDMGLDFIEHAFADHHAFMADDLQFSDGKSIIMTEKDAVKCRDFAPDNAWYLPVEARLGEAFFDALIAKVKQATAQM